MSRATAIDSAADVLATVLDVTVVYYEEAAADAFRQALPYATLEAINDASAGSIPRAVMDSEQADARVPNALTLTHQQRRRTTLQLAYYGDGAPDVLINLQLGLALASTRASLRTAGIGLQVVGDAVEDADEQRDTVREPAATQDLHLYWVASLDEDAHPIDTVSTTETIAPPVGA